MQFWFCFPFCLPFVHVVNWICWGHWFFCFPSAFSIGSTAVWMLSILFKIQFISGGSINIDIMLAVCVTFCWGVSGNSSNRALFVYHAMLTMVGANKNNVQPHSQNACCEHTMYWVVVVIGGGQSADATHVG